MRQLSCFHSSRVSDWVQPTTISIVTVSYMCTDIFILWIRYFAELWKTTDLNLEFAVVFFNTNHCSCNNFVISDCHHVGLWHCVFKNFMNGLHRAHVLLWQTCFCSLGCLTTGKNICWYELVDVKNDEMGPIMYKIGCVYGLGCHTV